MGTPHILKVIKDGRTVIRQYGQYDGDAATAGHNLCSFITKYGAETIRKLIDQTEIQEQSGPISVPVEVGEYFANINYLGDFFKFLGDPYITVIPSAIEKFGLQKTMQYYMLTRYTGYKVLHVIGVFSCVKEVEEGKCKIPVYLESDDMEDAGRKITLDLDNEAIVFDYIGKHKVWEFSSLPADAELKELDKGNIDVKHE